MAQQTGVEWLVRKLSTEIIGEIPLHRWDEIREAVGQAQITEREHFLHGYNEGYRDGMLDAGVAPDTVHNADISEFANAAICYDERFGKSTAVKE